MGWIIKIIKLNNMLYYIFGGFLLYILYNLGRILIDWFRISTGLSKICWDQIDDHKYEYGKEIKSIALRLYFMDVVKRKTYFSFNLVRLIGMVSYLQVVNKPEFNPNGTLKSGIEQFLHVQFLSEKKLILDIIDRIPLEKCDFSGGNLDWLHLIGIDGCIVRNYVRDAEKISHLDRMSNI